PRRAGREPAARAARPAALRPHGDARHPAAGPFGAGGRAVTPSLDLGALAPMLAVGTGVLLMPLLHVLLERTPALLGRPLSAEARGTYLAAASAAVLAVGLVLTLASFGELRVFDPRTTLVALDSVTAFLNATVLLAALLTVLSSSKFLAGVRANHGEYYT